MPRQTPCERFAEFVHRRSVDEVAKLLRVSKSFVSLVANGKRQPGSYRVLMQVQKHIGIPASAWKRSA